MGLPASVQQPAVTRLWYPSDKGIVVCIAPGPSLTYTDCRAIERSTRCSAIAINDACRVALTAGTRYSPDVGWWTKQSWVSAPHVNYPGHMYTLGLFDLPPGVVGLDYSPTEVLALNPGVLAAGGHGGYSAINLAYHQGATTIALLGYDMAPDPLTGAHHVGGDEPGQRHARYDRWIPLYGALTAALDRLSVRLVNCSRRTAIPHAAVPHLGLGKLLDGR